MAKDPKIVKDHLQELTQPVAEGMPAIKISKSIGFTVNLQAYESARLDCRIEITGALENADEIHNAIDIELEQAITKQIKELIEQVDPNKTLLGYKK